MFDIEEAKHRAKGKKVDISFVAVLNEELKAYAEDMTRALNRALSGRPFIGARPRQMIQRLCHESIFARLHDWEISYHPAALCWNCHGTLISYDEEQGIYACDICTAGWIPERWSYRCRRCNHYQSKG